MNLIRLVKGEPPPGRYNSVNGIVREYCLKLPLIIEGIDCGFPLATFVSAEQVMEGEVATDKEVVLQFSPGKVHLIRKQFKN